MQVSQTALADTRLGGFAPGLSTSWGFLTLY
jgi:hypothetical protein